MPKVERTKAQLYRALLNFMETGSAAIPYEELVAFIKREITICDRKSARNRREYEIRKTKTNPLKDEIYWLIPDDTYEIYPNISKKIHSYFDRDATDNMIIGCIKSLYESGLLARKMVKFPKALRRDNNRYFLYAFRRKKPEELSDEMRAIIPAKP